MDDRAKAMKRALAAGDGAAVELMLRLRTAPDIPVTAATLRRCLALGPERTSRRKRIRDRGPRWPGDEAWAADHDAALIEALALVKRRRREGGR